MNIAYTLTPNQLTDFLLNVATVRPVFIWGAPGIGKSSLVQEFAAQVGLDCVSLLGSQLAPEDLMGVPQIIDGKSRFCPPSMIARAAAYCLSSWRSRSARSSSKDLPAEKPDGSSAARELAHRAKGLLKELSAINLEVAQMAVANLDDQPSLPSWFLVEVVRDLPRLVDRKPA